jgi:hypothetical protein
MFSSFTDFYAEEEDQIKESNDRHINHSHTSDINNHSIAANQVHHGVDLMLDFPEDFSAINITDGSSILHNHTNTSNALPFSTISKSARSSPLPADGLAVGKSLDLLISRVKATRHNFNKSAEIQSDELNPAISTVKAKQSNQNSYSVNASPTTEYNSLLFNRGNLNNINSSSKVSLSSPTTRSTSPMPERNPSRALITTESNQGSMHRSINPGNNNVLSSQDIAEEREKSESGQDTKDYSEKSERHRHYENSQLTLNESEPSLGQRSPIPDEENVENAENSFNNGDISAVNQVKLPETQDWFITEANNSIKIGELSSSAPVTRCSSHSRSFSAQNTPICTQTTHFPSNSSYFRDHSSASSAEIRLEKLESKQIAAFSSFTSCTDHELIHKSGSSAPTLLFELCNSHSAVDRSYFRLFLPQTNSTQQCTFLCCRKKSKQNKWRFSLNDNNMGKKNNPDYEGKMTLENGNFGAEKGQNCVAAETVCHFLLSSRSNQPCARISVSNKLGKHSVSVQIIGDYVKNNVEITKNGLKFTGNYNSYVQPLLTLSIEARRTNSVLLSSAALTISKNYVGRTVLQVSKIAQKFNSSVSSSNNSGIAESGGALSPNTVNDGRYVIEFDYPLTIFLTFAILCALESYRLLHQQA